VNASGFPEGSTFIKVRLVRGPVLAVAATGLAVAAGGTAIAATAPTAVPYASVVPAPVLSPANHAYLDMKYTAAAQGPRWKVMGVRYYQSTQVSWPAGS
jgi:hypothetical protein